MGRGAQQVVVLGHGYCTRHQRRGGLHKVSELLEVPERQDGQGGGSTG